MILKSEHQYYYVSPRGLPHMASIVVAVVIQLPSLEILPWAFRVCDGNENRQEYNFCIYASCHAFLQCIYMSKILYLITLICLVFQTQNQANPEPPIQILQRLVSIQDIAPIILQGLCGHCDSLSPTCIQNLKYIAQNAQTKFTLQNITKNPDNITEFINKIVTINGSFEFPNQKRNLKNTSMRYLLSLPRKTQKIKGVVLYFHSTIFGTYEIPVCQTALFSSIAALYTSNGYAIIFPNLLGYEGVDYYPHPYFMYPWQNVKAGILALNDGLDYLKFLYNQNAGKFQVFAVGYQEGASYAVWVQKCLQSEENCQGVKLDSAYVYKGAAGLAGPYDLINTVKPFMTEKISEKKNNTFNIQNQTVTNFEKPSRLMATLISYIYYGESNTYYGAQINSEFWQMNCTKPIPQKNCEFNETRYYDILSLLRSKQKSLDIVQAIGYSAFSKSYSDKKEKYLGTSKSQYENGNQNSVYNLVSEKFINSKDLNNALQTASAINNEPKNKVFLFSLKRDSVIPVSNTEKYESKYGRGKVQTYYFENNNNKVCVGEDFATVVPVDHGSAQILANIFALAFIKGISGV